INGKTLPYVEVLYEFTRNPAKFSFTTTDRYNGGIRMRRKRTESEEIPIPVKISRREAEDKSWFDIIEEITDISDVDRLLEFSFPDYRSDRFYLAQAIEFNITEEHEYVSKGELVILPEKNVMYGNNKGVQFDGSKTIEIKGQESPSWEALVTVGGKT